MMWVRPVPGAAVFLWHDFLLKPAGDFLLRHLLERTSWRQDSVMVYGKRHKLPRLQQWYGDGCYRWSGLTIQPRPWTHELSLVREAVQVATRRSFNSVLANHYRDGNDTVGWHSDDESELGSRPVIASLSLGVGRDFCLRRRSNHHARHSLRLKHGSLLVMAGDTQTEWEHAVPRRKKVTRPRVNLTFRWIR